MVEPTGQKFGSSWTRNPWRLLRIFRDISVPNVQLLYTDLQVLRTSRPMLGKLFSRWECHWRISYKPFLPNAVSFGQGQRVQRLRWEARKGKSGNLDRISFWGQLTPSNLNDFCYRYRSPSSSSASSTSFTTRGNKNPYQPILTLTPFIFSKDTLCTTMRLAWKSQPWTLRLLESRQLFWRLLSVVTWLSSLSPLVRTNTVCWVLGITSSSGLTVAPKNTTTRLLSGTWKREQSVVKAQSLPRAEETGS